MANLLEMEEIIKIIQKYIQTKFGLITCLIVKRYFQNCFQDNY